jgi:hypothetical protein
MELLLERYGLKVWGIEDGKLSVTNSVTTLNHFSPNGTGLGKGRYMSEGQKELAEKLVIEAVEAKR